MFERGGVFFDPELPLDQSCYEEVSRTNLLVLLIGGRYGSPASEGDRAGKEYTSVTRREFETAIAYGVPILVFARREVDVELRTYLANPKKVREQLNYASVDSTQIFRLLEQIYQLKKGNPVFTYDQPSDIIDKLDRQLVGYLAAALHEKKQRAAEKADKLNGFKLFYYRHQAGLSQRALAEKSGLSTRLIAKLEHVPLESKMKLGEHLFQTASAEVFEKLESALGCEGALSAGQEDDFLSLYIHYFGVYKRRRARKGKSSVNQLDVFPTRVLVLDFEGTMTLRSEDDLTTWEKIWVLLGYQVSDCSGLARRFFNGEIDHREWCELTREHFVARDMRESHLDEVAQKVALVPGVRETLSQLRSAGVSMFVVSGSIRLLIRKVLGDIYEYFDEVHANDFIFTGSGALQTIRGTAYDFQGKGEFIKSVIARQDVSPLEVLFVGNSLNDVWASNAGARTLCVNPHFTNPNDARDWTYCVRQMKHFGEILPFIGDLDSK